jgi:uncharacterized protein (DUF362 family)/NAD-dependent dihydropyrimidine dehydrogenase PreA subunit
MTSTNQPFKQIVTIQKSTYNNLAIPELLAPLGGMKAFVNRNERVLVKVNLLAASTPESAVITHPTVVREVAVAVQNAGGIPYIGDSPSREFSKRRLEKVYERAGLIKLSNDLGVELNYDTRTEKVVLPYANKLKKSPICKYVLDADKIIALPKLKTHSLMILTLATKIMYGAIPGLTKARFHSKFFRKENFAEMLLDILTIVPPHLIVMDGVVGMHGDGPMSGPPVNIGLMLAATDSIAMDLAICKILGIESMGVPTLKRAKLRGWWPNDINYPLLSPQTAAFSGFRLPATASYPLTDKKRPKRSPVPNKKCNGCGDCERICPRKAIRLVNERATVDYSLCIQCYCCHEVCPENAIDLKVLK